MSKYVIEFEDEPCMAEENMNFYKCIDAPWYATSRHLIDKLTPYDENDAYQRGLNDAWEAAKKITLNINRGGIPREELTTIFGEFNLYGEIMERNTASKAVAKLKEYEQKKADDKPFNRIKAQIESMMHVQGINIADICMAVEELMEEQNESD